MMFGSSTFGQKQYYEKTVQIAFLARKHMELGFEKDWSLATDVEREECWARAYIALKDT